MSMPNQIEELIVLSAAPTMAEIDEKILLRLYEESSDIFIQANWYVMARIGGVMMQVTKRKMNDDVVDKLLTSMTSVSVRGDVINGTEKSWTHRVMRDGAKPLRFRLAARTVQTLHGLQNINLVARPIDNQIRELDSLGLPKSMLRNCIPEDGLVLLSGPTGSGKTTLLASIQQKIARHPDGKSLATAEDPVEFNLHGISDRTGVITQAEKGRNFRTFAQVMKSLLRENPDYIVYGELRDAETISIATEACQTGHGVYATVHTNSVAGTYSRLAAKFRGDERDAMIGGLIDASRLFFHQRLYKKVGGGRVPIYEWVSFSAGDRTVLQEAYESGGLGRLTIACQELVDQKGESLEATALQARERGDISEEQYESIVKTHQLELKSDLSVEVKQEDRAVDAFNRIAVAIESILAQFRGGK